MGSYLNRTKTNNQKPILQELGVVYTPLIPAQVSTATWLGPV